MAVEIHAISVLFIGPIVDIFDVFGVGGFVDIGNSGVEYCDFDPLAFDPFVPVVWKVEFLSQVG